MRWVWLLSTCIDRSTSPENDARLVLEFFRFFSNFIHFGSCKTQAEFTVFPRRFGQAIHATNWSANFLDSRILFYSVLRISKFFAKRLLVMTNTVQDCKSQTPEATDKIHAKIIFCIIKKKGLQYVINKLFALTAYVIHINKSMVPLVRQSL